MTAPISREQRDRLIELTEAGIPLAQQAYENVVQIRTRISAAGVRGHDEILNVLDLVLLWHFDLLCLQQDIARYSGSARAGLYARSALLSIHESAQTLRKIMGPSFRRQFVEFMGQQPWEQTLLDAHAAFSDLFKQSERRFGKVRRGLLAHRDPDPSLRHDLVADANVRAVADLLIDALRALSLIHRLFAEYTSRLRSVTDRSLSD